MAARQRQRLHRFWRALLAAVLPIGLLPIGLMLGATAAQAGSDHYASIVVEARSGRVLSSDSPDALHRPASLAKLMTLYMTFEALRDRRIKSGALVPVSAHCASMEPSKLGLVPGTRITVHQAILSLVTKSANDAACALGELLGGSEARYAQMATLRGRALGLTRTTFTNASGLPDPGEWTTARDMAVLARRLISDFPEDYHYFATPSFVFRGRRIPNHDRLLKTYPGADGMKTGYTDAAGHNLVTSAVRGGVRLIGVVLGAGSNIQRDRDMTVALNESFEDLGVGHGATRVAGRFHLIGSAHAETVPRVRRVAAREKATPASGWTIQVGSFRNPKAAHRAARVAKRKTHRGEPHVQKIRLRHHTWWRAQVTDLTKHHAWEACRDLTQHKRHPKSRCIVLAPEHPMVASR